MMKSSKLPVVFAILSVALAPAGAAFSQSPLGREIRINTITAHNQDSQQVAAGADGGFAVVWLSAKGDASPFFPYVAARFFDASGASLSSELELPQAEGQYRGQPFVMTKPGGGFRVLTQRATLQDILAFDLEDYSSSGASQGTIGSIAPLDPRMTITNSFLTPAGRLILSWLPTQFEVKAARFSARGQLLGSEIPVAAGQEPTDPLYFGDVEADRNGNAVVTWTGDCGSFDDDAHCDVFAQRLAASGQKVGAAVRVNTYRTGIQEWARVAVAPDGRFLAVWQTREPNNPDRFAIDVAAQLFSPLGVKIGSEIRLGPVVGTSELFPEAASDANGNFVAVWSSFRRENGVYGWDILGQLFRKDGRRIGKEFRINTRQTGNEFSEPKVAFGGNGTFVVVWNAKDGDFDGVFAQRFLASPGDEPCTVRGTLLSCDAGRSGGAAELQLTLAGGTVVFGDVDRDGREDPCVFQAGRFQCDTDHRGAPYELSLSFGAAGDAPLFGDVDGDGRDEPCLRRGRLTLCDTRHNGGRAEAQFQIGDAADQPLMGDLNGDGRDEACVFQAGRFSCDTKHNGGADVNITFGQAGDLAVLGDYDGDGDDDPCVFRAGRLLCDLAHNGGAAEAELALGQAGDRPLLGNLDGL